MTTPPDAQHPPAETGPDAQALAELLAAIDASPAFRHSARQRRLLRHIVDKAVAGDAAALKESVLAVEVFGRSAASFDPRQDTIVRVELRRLRQRLAQHQRGAGRHAAWQVLLPVGSYVPQFVRQPAAQPAVSRLARDLVERGEHYLRQPLTAENIGAALQRFDAAAADSPRCAAAHVGRARALLNLATGWHRPPGEAAVDAEAALAQALAIDPAQPVALALRGAVLSQFRRDWPAARQAFEAALSLAPHEAFVHSAYGCHLRMHGHLDEAERCLQTARRLDPQYLNTRMHLVNLRIDQRLWHDAQQELDALRDLAGPMLSTLGLQAVIAFALGNTAAGLAALEQLHAQAPADPARTLVLAGALAVAGQPARAAALTASVDPTRVAPYVRAIHAVRCGQPEAALQHLEAALARCDPLAVQIPGEPAFEALHGHPAWPPLARRARQPA